MATFLDYETSPGLHPAVQSYLASGSPLRIQYMNSLGPQSQPNMRPSPPPTLISGANKAPLPSLYPGGTAAALAAIRNPGTPLVQPPAAGSGGNAAGLGPINYQDDPILQNVLAAQKAALQTARGSLASQWKEMLLGYGSQELARSTLGELFRKSGYKSLDAAKNLDPYYASISDNPDTSLSTLARLARSLRETTTATNEQLNANGNLFFSGARGRALRDLDYQHQAQVADASQALRQALNAAQKDELGVESSWQQQVLQAQADAYNRALQMALARAAAASGGGGSVSSSDTGQTSPAPPPPPPLGIQAVKAALGYGTTIPWTAGL